MEEYGILKQAWQYHPKGKRNVGRPMKRWSEQIHEQERTSRIQSV
jgi:hypothetical protein